MAKIEDALPNETITDEAFVEQEVTVPEDSVPTQEGQDAEADNMNRLMTQAEEGL